MVHFTVQYMPGNRSSKLLVINLSFVFIYTCMSMLTIVCFILHDKNKYQLFKSFGCGSPAKNVFTKCPVSWRQKKLSFIPKDDEVYERRWGVWKTMRCMKDDEVYERRWGVWNASVRRHIAATILSKHGVAYPWERILYIRVKWF